MVTDMVYRADNGWGRNMQNSEEKNQQVIKSDTHKAMKLERVTSGVTNDRKVEQVLQCSDDVLENIFNAISDWVVLTDMKCRILKSNLSGEKFTGISPEEMIGKSCCKLVHGSTKHISGCPFKEAIRTGRRASVELWEPKSQRCLAITIDPIRDEKGQIKSAVHIVRDITQQKKVEESLKGSEEKFKSIFEHANDGIAYLDSFGRILDVNKKVEQIFGGSRGELVNKHFTKLGILSIKDIPKYIRMFQDILKGKMANVTVPITNKEGREVFLECSASLIKPDGESARIMVIARDITERKKAEEELRIKDKAISTSINAIAIADLDGNLTYVNNAFIRMWGYNEIGEVLGRVANHFWQVPERLEGRMKAFRHGGGWIDEVPAQRRDGSLFAVQLSTSVILNQIGKPCNIMTSFIDITERKKAEKMLRESEERFKSVFENTLIGLYRTTPDGRIIMANPALVRMLGYNSFGELAKRNLEQYGFEPDYPRSEFKRLIETEGKVIGLESAWYKMNGTVLFVRESARAVCDNDGNALYYEGTVENITERKKAEEELQKEHNLLRLLIDNIPDRIYLKDRKHQFILGNDTVVKYEGFKYEKDLLGKTDFDLYPKELAERFYAVEKEVIQKRRPLLNNEELFINKQGNEQWTLTTKLPLQDETGNILGIVGIHRDITERKKAEEEITKLGQFPSENPNPVLRLGKDWTIIYSNKAGFAILETLGRQIGESPPETFTQRVGKAVRSGHISTFDFKCHDGRIFELKLAPILDMGYVNIYGLDITKRKQVEESLREYHGQLQSLASQLTLAEERERRRIATALHDQISQPLAISKIKIEEMLHSGGLDDSHKVLRDVRDWLSKAMMDTRLLTSGLCSPVLYELGFEKAVAAWLDEEIQGKHNIRTELSVDGKLKYLDDDIRALLFRDVRELLINVVKHAQAKKVKVSINKVNDMIQVRVEDDGIGFEPAELSSARGSAFGLFSIRERLEHLGGRFEIDSAPGRGCGITMLAPLKRDKALDGENK